MSTAGGNSIPPEQLKVRYLGTGHADISKHEWITNQHRDTLASHVAHYDQLSYYAVAQNESIARLRLNMLEKIYSPCGAPPKKEDV
ncbi:splicing factor 3B subunit 5 [Chaetoceros tenuissimus]|uniref:Splicing factor subunit n=1 Tax=Chaetoceros tenuissimus TaxID=426638 RepID=A0AAD3CIT1_9STRA|nr:splicing factor 3B subunit 5 [Chaetoceros tenuissimus]